MTATEISYNMRYFTMIKIGFLLGILVFLSSCLSIKSGSTKSGKKYYETFFVGEDGTQYFIKPLAFSNDENEELQLDITFRYRNEIKDSAIVNLSFLSKEIVKSTDSLPINNDSIAITIKEMKYLFSERKKEIFNSRFSAKVSLSDVAQLFDNPNWHLILYKNGNYSKYSPSKTTKKKIEELDYEIFSLF